MKRIVEDPTQYLHREHAQTFIHESGRFLMRVGEKRIVREILSRYGDRKETVVLDVGSGPGWVATMLAKERSNWSITGLDASPQMLAHATELAKKKNLCVEWVKGLADKTGLPDEKFTLIVSSLAFHEFPDPRAAIKEMLRVLKKGGSIFIVDLLRPSKLGLLYYKCINLFVSPFSAAFRTQFIESLKSAYKADELREIVEEMSLSYTLGTEMHFGTYVYHLEIRKP